MIKNERGSLKRFTVLDSFRGLAAIFVVVFHMHYVGSITESNFFRQSYLFVDFFFILSGFVLAHGYAFKEKIKFKNFIISRTFRLLPLHIVILIVFIFLEFGKLLAYNNGLHFNNKPFSGLTHFNEIIPNLFLLQSWLPNAQSQSWNYPSWSISIEYYMYIIFFITLSVKENLKYIGWFLISIIMFILLFIDNDLVNSNIPRGLSSFFMGSLMYVLYKYTNKRINMNIYIFSIIAITILCLVVYCVSADFEYKSLFLNILFCTQIYIFSFEKGFISYILQLKIFLELGKLSYSIYMIHAVVLFCILSVAIVMSKLFGIELSPMLNEIRYIDLGSTIYNNMMFLLILGIIVYISGFKYKYIEQKGQKFGKTFISEDKKYIK